MSPAPCVHCQKRQASRAWGLCWRCSRIRDVRTRYIPASWHRRGKRRRCVHCHERLVWRNCQLCRHCYRIPDVLAHYHPQAHRNKPPEVPDHYGPAPLPERPTRCRPGSEDKIRVLAQRASLGQALFHPRDGEEDDKC